MWYAGTDNIISEFQNSLGYEIYLRSAIDTKNKKSIDYWKKSKNCSTGTRQLLFWKPSNWSVLSVNSILCGISCFRGALTKSYFVLEGVLFYILQLSVNHKIVFL